MSKSLAARLLIVGGVSVGWLTAGCNGPSSDLSRLPTAPAGSPSNEPAPTVRSIFPTQGSVGGGTPVIIQGTGFATGAVVMIDGAMVAGRLGRQDALGTTTLYLETPSHAAGRVDIVIVNPDGKSGTFKAGFVYALPNSFDANGRWEGFSYDGTDRAVALVIRDNRVVSASCIYDDVVAFPVAALPAVVDGEFAIVAGEAKMSGRIVSATEIAGIMNVPGCTLFASPWRVQRQPE